MASREQNPEDLAILPEGIRIDRLNEKQHLIFVLTTGSICFVVTALRGHLRWKANGRLYSDDYWAFAAGLGIFIIALHYIFMLPGAYESQRYTEFETPQMTPEEYEVYGLRFLKWLFSMMMFWWITLWSVKASFLALIGRLVSGIPIYRKWWLVAVAFTICTFIASIANNFFSCTPLWRRWSLDPESVCTNPKQLKSTYITIWVPAGIDIASDLFILTMPVLILSKLQLSRSRRIAVISMFSLSLLVVAICIIRVVLLTGLGGNINMVVFLIWTWVEVMVAVLIVNVPAFKSIYTRFVPSSAVKSFENKPPSRFSRLVRSRFGAQNATELTTNPSTEDIEMGNAGRQNSRDSEAYLKSSASVGVYPESTSTQGKEGIHVTSEFSIQHKFTKEVNNGGTSGNGW